MIAALALAGVGFVVGVALRLGRFARAQRQLHLLLGDGDGVGRVAAGARRGGHPLAGAVELRPQLRAIMVALPELPGGARRGRVEPLHPFVQGRARRNRLISRDPRPLGRVACPLERAHRFFDIGLAHADERVGGGAGRHTSL